MKRPHDSTDSDDDSDSGQESFVPEHAVKPATRAKSSGVMRVSKALAVLLPLALAQVTARNQHGCEYFAGVKAITRAMIGMGYKFESFEIQDAEDGSQDINTKQGFLRAMVHICKTMHHAHIWVAVVCSTWVFMSKSSTGRHIHVLGYQDNIGVHYANVMVHRVCLLLELATSINVDWVVEQPRSSTLHEHPRWVLMTKRMQAVNVPLQRVNTSMGAFRGQTVKSLKFFGTAPWLPNLEVNIALAANSSAGRGMFRKEEKPDGTVAISGGSELNASQAYTPEFGLAVACAYHGYASTLGPPLPREKLRVEDFEFFPDDAEGDGDAHCLATDPTPPPAH